MTREVTRASGFRTSVMRPDCFSRWSRVFHKRIRQHADEHVASVRPAVVMPHRTQQEFAFQHSGTRAPPRSTACRLPEFFRLPGSLLRSTYTPSRPQRGLERIGVPGHSRRAGVRGVTVMVTKAALWDISFRCPRIPKFVRAVSDVPSRIRCHFFKTGGQSATLAATDGAFLLTSRATAHQQITHPDTLHGLTSTSAVGASAGVPTARSEFLLKASASVRRRRSRTVAPGLRNLNFARLTMPAIHHPHPGRSPVALFHHRDNLARSRVLRVPASVKWANGKPSRVTTNATSTACQSLR